METVSHDRELDRLRRALAADGGPAGPACPPAERIWAAVAGELPPRELRRLVHHAAGCPACHPAWRLARKLAAGAPRDERSAAAAPAPLDAAPAGRQRASPGRRWWLPAIAAAAAVALVAAALLLPTVRQPPATRGAGVEIRSLIAAEPLPRDRFTLRWTPVEAARYQVEVTSGLDLVDRAAGLERPEHTVAPDRLADLPGGAVVRWRVTATPPAGEPVRSPVFTVRLR